MSDEKNKGGRPRIEFSKDDWVNLEKLCGIQCTGEEVARFFKIDYDTLNARIIEKYEVGFSDYLKKHGCDGKISLRRNQFKLANAGSVPMNIWLGKQYLGQTDHQEIKQTTTIQIATPEELIKISEAMKEKKLLEKPVVIDVESSDN